MAAAFVRFQSACKEVLDKVKTIRIYTKTIRSFALEFLCVIVDSLGFIPDALPSPVYIPSGKKRGLLSRTAAGNRAQALVNCDALQISCHNLIV